MDQNDLAWALDSALENRWGQMRRELFAAMAMQALLSNNAARLDCMKAGVGEEKAIAHYAVEQADALLAALMSGNTPK